jgi:hypothetical protein
MSRRGLIAAAAATAFAASRGWSQAPQSGPAPAASTRALRTRFAGRFAGDFDEMIDRRLIRLVAPYSPTLFFEARAPSTAPQLTARNCSKIGSTRRSSFAHDR